MKLLAAFALVLSGIVANAQYTILGTSGEETAESTSISPLTRTVNNHDIEWHQEPRYTCEGTSGPVQFGEGEPTPDECRRGNRGVVIRNVFVRDFPSLSFGDGRFLFKTTVSQRLDYVAEGVEVQLGRNGVVLGNDIIIPGWGGWGYGCHLRVYLQEIRGKTSLYIEPSTPNANTLYRCGLGGSDGAGFAGATNDRIPQTYCLSADSNFARWRNGHTTCDAGWTRTPLYCPRNTDWTALFWFSIVYSQGGLQVHKQIQMFPSMDVPGQQHGVNRGLDVCVDA